MSMTWRISMILCIIMSVDEVCGKLTEREKVEYCETLQCEETSINKVCGIRKENGIKTYRLFDNECLILKYGCHVKTSEEAYGIIDMKYCIKDMQQEKNETNCSRNCDLNLKKPVCGIRKNGEGFSIKIFSNKCQLAKHNCEQRSQFTIIDFFICTGATNHQHIIKRRNDDTKKKIQKSSVEEINDERENIFDKETKDLNKSMSFEVINNFNTSLEEISETQRNSCETTNNESYIEQNSEGIYNINTADTDDVRITKETALESFTTNTPSVKNKTTHKNLVIIRGSMKDLHEINMTANRFFGATHVFDLPVQDIYPNLTDVTRRRLIHIFGPLKVFVPRVVKPKVIKYDYYHKPTLSSCFHKCPQKCPNTYAPVCGLPGPMSREPSIMFQNHCYMDVAQCKIYWEDKSETARSNAYEESSFLFCIGDELSGVYRFLPIIKTLQHMSRLGKKRKYKHRPRNFRFMNEMIGFNPKLMG